MRSLLTTPADGYTFAILANGIIIDQVLKKAADFDIRTDLMPVARAVEAPMGVFVSNTLPVNSIKELTPLADWLNAHGRHHFLLTAPPLRLPGAVGSPATPVATV